MYEEQFLAEKLQQFSLLDIALVKIVYFLVGLLVATNYIVLTSVSWIFLFIDVSNRCVSNSNPSVLI